MVEPLRCRWLPRRREVGCLLTEAGGVADVGGAVRIVRSAGSTMDVPLFLMVPSPHDITRLPRETLPAGSLPDKQKKTPKSHTALPCR